MNIPTQVKVFGYTIPVETFEEPFWVECLDGRRVLAEGHYNVSTNKIRVTDPNSDPAVGGTTFIHELIEVVNRKSDLKMNHTQITTLASALYQSLEPCFADAA